MSLKTKNRIKIILAEKEKTNKWLAEKIGRDQTTISRWCTNKVQPTLDMLGEIASVLNVDVRELIAPREITHEFQEAK